MKGIIPPIPMIGAVAWLAVALAGTPVRADIGPPRTVRLELSFENLADYPEHDFYLVYGLGRGNPYASPHVVRVASSQPVRLEGIGRLTPAYLVAVPLGVAPPTPQSRDWEETLSRFPLHTRLDKMTDDYYSGYRLSYRVTIASDQLSVVQTAQSLSPAFSFRGRLGQLIVGLVLSFVCAFTVIWSLRRRRRVAAEAVNES